MDNGKIKKGTNTQHLLAKIAAYESHSATDILLSDITIFELTYSYFRYFAKPLSVCGYLNKNGESKVAKTEHKVDAARKNVSGRLAWVLDTFINNNRTKIMKQMLTKLLPLAFLLNIAFIDVARAMDSTANHYKIRLTVNPQTRALKVVCNLQLIADTPLDSVSLLLNKDLKISRFSSKEAKSHSIYPGVISLPHPLKNTREIVVRFAKRLQAGQVANLYFEYEGVVDNAKLEIGRGLVAPQWTELSMGAGWYPLCLAENMQTYQVAVTTPQADYRVEGGGKVSKKNPTQWVVTETHPATRISLLISNALHQKIVKAGETTIALYALNPEDTLLTKIATAARQALRLYAEQYGKPVSNDTVKFFFANKPVPINYPTEAYSANGSFVVLQSNNNEQDQIEIVAHEIAHFWWTYGKLQSYHEFLTESLAEYSKLRLLQQYYGLQAYQQQVDRYKKYSRQIKTIKAYNTDLNNRSAYMYSKGPLVLMELEEMMGAQAFNQLLRKTHRNKISTYEAFLEQIALVSGREMANKFDLIF